MNSFVERLQGVQADLDEAVSRLVENHSEMMKTLPETSQSTLLAEKLAEFSKRPSKRIRGALVMAAYEACGGKNHAVSLELAALVELYHNYLLIVDDVMDESATRRGGPTVHEQYKLYLPKQSDGYVMEHTAGMIAINVGLIVQHLLSRRLCELSVEPKLALEVQKTLHANLTITGLGQLEDVAHVVSDSLTEEDITRMYAHKSGYYTFVNPLQLGVLLANKNDSLHSLIEMFGVPAGIMFQLQDDLIGVYGDPAVTGKSVLDDLREGKMTVLVQHMLTHANNQDKKLMQRILGNKEITISDYNTAVKLLAKYGSRDYVQRRIADYTEQAKTILDNKRMPNGLKAYLHDMLNYLQNRVV